MRRLLVLGFSTPDKAELGTPIYFGNDADAAASAVKAANHFRIETYQLSSPIKRRMGVARPTPLPEPTPSEGQEVEGSGDPENEPQTSIGSQGAAGSRKRGRRGG